MKNVLFITIGIVLLGGILWYASSSNSEDNKTIIVNSSNTTSQTSPIDSTTQEDIVNYAIDLDEFSFSPKEISIESGEEIKVKITNKGSAIHDFVIDELGVNSGILQPGESTIVSITAPESPATYEIYCSVGSHRDLGMVGSFRVGSSSTESQSSITPGEYFGLAPAEFKELIEAEDILVVDVHIPEQPHIDGTDEIIPYTDIDSIEDAIVKTDAKKVAIYCRSGGMSREASSALVAKGYDVYDLSGGRNAWVSAGLN